MRIAGVFGSSLSPTRVCSLSHLDMKPYSVAEHGFHEALGEL